MDLCAYILNIVRHRILQEKIIVAIFERSYAYDAFMDNQICALLGGLRWELMFIGEKRLE